MKRTINTILAVFVLSLPVSCSKEGNGSMLSEFTPYVETFSFKSEIGSDGEYVFNDGDRALVSNGSRVSEFVYDSASGKFRTSSPIPRTDAMQAVYPASAAEFKGGRFSVNLASTVSISASSVQEFPLYLWKVRDDVFKFRSFCGIARLKLEGGGTALYEAPLTKVIFTSTGNPCCGTAELATDGSLQFTSPGQTLEVICGEGMDVRSEICLTLPAHKYPMGSSVTFQFADGRSMTAETIMGIVPRSGMIKTYSIEVTADLFGPLEDYEEAGPLE